MIPPAVAEQQAKLGVSAEDSKAQRLKRQQARFRDRGGAFVPSNTNPLVDILLARTVSGESPTKAWPKGGAAKRVSPRKPRQTSPTRRAVPATIAQESQAVAGSSKAKRAPSRKGKGKAVEPPAEPVAEPPPKGRGTKKGRKKAEDRGSDAEQPLPANTKSKPASKGRGKQRAAPSTSDGNPKPKPKPKAKAKTNPAKVVVEIFDSDAEQTLVRVPRKTKSISKKNIQYDDDGETDDDAPIIRKQAKRRAEDSKASRIKTAARVKIERVTPIGSPVKELDEREEWKQQDEKCSKLSAKKRLVWRDEDEDEVEVPPAKKGKKSTTTKSTAALEPEPAPPATKDVKSGKNAKGAGRRGRAEPDRDIIEAKQDDESLPKPEPKKRKKAEDNYDDRPRKVVKFAETGTTHPPSQKLKENQSDKKCERTPKSSITDEMDALRTKLSTNPRAKTPKGPPLEVLRRIKASAARYLRCVDSEPDELDCLS